MKLRTAPRLYTVRSWVTNVHLTNLGITRPKIQLLLLSTPIAVVPLTQHTGDIVQPRELANFTIPFQYLTHARGGS